MLLIAIPVYGGVCYADFMLSVFNLCKELTKLKIPHEIKLIQNESLISRARNGFVAMFMDNFNYSKLLFLDADLIFDSNTIIRMIKEDKPIVGAIYPKKNINWSKVKHFSNKVDTTELEIRATDLNYNFKYYNKNQVKIENGFAEVQDLATGCMLIDKRALSIIINKFRHYKYTNHCYGYGNSDCFYDLFQTGVVEQDNKRIYLSEDYYFCYLAKQCGIELWADIHATMCHIGRCNYIGNLGMILQDSSGEKLDLDNIIQK
tara:strand:- start:33 stop:815 length:783 start_codon:yes stop_codon:yes gene_type:complete